ncbi:hypothetical protein AVEN_146156-1 [Araneus ventricosus]|uniref:Uncharacterized protein n=1 Tax=Araneus ventricosus TaxID=182803 RepID=A0A4Y2EFK6_ARAVE|nr:hypothetical protein AVEN_146156-1 [Araneus ventricosus]
MEPLPLHSQKVTVWCGFTAAPIVCSFFSEEIGSSGPLTCAVNGTRYESLLRNQLIPAPQQPGRVDSAIFMQDGALPQITTPVNMYFGNYRIINRRSSTAWPPGSPDLNPCDFWLWGYLKDVVYVGPMANLAELKKTH